MKHTHEYFDISVLLYKKRVGLLSEQEEIILEEWKMSSSENQSIYTHLTSELKIQQKKQQYETIDASKAWENLQPRIHVKIGKERKLLANFLRYAAVILLPLAIGSFLVYQVTKTSEDYSASIVEQITPGVNKATLVLSDGSIVDLEQKKDTLINGQALNHNNKLSYNIKTDELAKVDSKWHKLIVPIGGEYQLQLADGTKVWLNSDSELKYTGSFTGRERIVFLKGEAYFEVSKDKNHPFIVKTNTMDVKVYGTEFNVMAYTDEEIAQTTLVEGSVSVDLKNESGLVQSAMLKPGMQAEFLNGNVEGTFKEVDASLYTGWKDGKFQFNNEELGTIMRKLARWYGVKFFTQNQDVQKIRFSGEMKRFDDFSTILNLLEFGSGVEFEVQGKTVTVRSVKK